MRRKGQHGSVFQKERRKNDKWLLDKPAYLRFWMDIPGQLDPRREVISLGICRSLRDAQRKADKQLLQLGINSAQRFREATSRTTFQQQAKEWLKLLSMRKRNPLEHTTIDNRRYTLDKWIYPFFWNCTLGEINNRTVKELVEKMAVKLAASSIRDYVNVVKAVVASAKQPASIVCFMLFSLDAVHSALAKRSVLRSTSTSLPTFVLCTSNKKRRPVKFSLISKQRAAKGKWICAALWQEC